MHISDAKPHAGAACAACSYSQIQAPSHGTLSKLLTSCQHVLQAYHRQIVHVGGGVSRYDDTRRTSANPGGAGLGPAAGALLVSQCAQAYGVFAVRLSMWQGTDTLCSMSGQPPHHQVVLRPS